MADDFLSSLSMAIPEIWIEENLNDPLGYEQPFQMRPFQQEIVDLIYNDGDSKFAFSVGRQCLTLDEYVYTKDGPKQVKDIKDGDEILGGIVSDRYEFEDDVYEIVFDNGIRIKANKEHPFYVEGKGWMRLEELIPLTAPRIEFYNSSYFNINNKMIDYYDIVSLLQLNLDIKVDLMDGDNFLKITDISDRDKAVKLQYQLWKYGLISVIVNNNDAYSIIVQKNINGKSTSIAIKSINYIGKQTVVGWETIGSHEIISYCGMRTHNCGKSVIMAAIAIHRAYVMNRHVVFVTPSEVHIQNIWDKILGLLKHNTSIQYKGKQKPYRVLWFNGHGSIKGLLGGSGDDASVTLRGFGGEDIFIDEAAYLSPQAWHIIKPYLTNAKNYKWVLTSTPSPFEDEFYIAHHSDDLGYITRIYATPDANPNWNDEMDRMMRESMTPEEYDREILAKFPKTSGGVFIPANIEAAMVKYNYDLSNFDTNKFKYVMSVDWNTPANGTQIIITGFSKEMVYIKYREIIANIENLQTKSVERIIHLNSIVPLEHIFVDAGYGNTQIEMLMDYGKQHPESNIRKKLVSIDFNKGNTVRVKINKNKPENKPPKPFMVGLLQKLLQDHRFQFSASDNHKKTGLYKQLRNFKIKKKGFGATPVYVDGYFHGIIAVMIGLLGMWKLYSRYSADRIISDIGAFVPFDSSNATNAFVENTMNDRYRIPTVEEIRNRDPKWIEYNDGTPTAVNTMRAQSGRLSQREFKRLKRRSF